MNISKRENTFNLIRNIIFYLIVIIISSIFIYLPIKNIIIGIYSWHIKQPEVTQGLIQVFVCFLILLLLVLLVKNKNYLIFSIICLFGFYLQAHQVLFSLIIVWIYFEMMIQIGNIFNKITFRNKINKSVSKNIINYLSNFLIGFIVWSAIIILFSLFNIGSANNIRVITIIIFILCIISKFIYKNDIMLINKLKKSFILLNKTQMIIYIGIILLIAIQCVKGSKVTEFDSLWYGLFGDRRLFGDLSFYNSLGLTRFVNYYPKLFELFLAPFSDLNILSFIFSINILFYLFILLTCFCIIRLLKLDVTKSLLLILIIGTVPCLANWASTAKHDLSTVFFLYLVTLFLILLFKTKNIKYLYLAIIACFPSVCLKTHGIFYLFSLFIGFIFAFISFKIRRKNLRNDLNKRNHIYYISFLMIGFFVTFGIHLRTYVLTGYPMYPTFLEIWQKVGFSGKYPFENPKVNAMPEIGNIPNIKFILNHVYCMFFNPRGMNEYVNHAKFDISWPGVVFAWFSIVLFLKICFQFKKTKDKLFILYRNISNSFLIILPVIIIGIIYALFMYQIGFDGNYYIFPVTISIILFGLLFFKTVYFNHNINNKKKANNVISIFLIIFLLLTQFYYMFISHASWEPGTKKYDFNIIKPIFLKKSVQFNNTYEHYQLLDIEDYILTIENKNPRVLGIDENKIYNLLSWRYEALVQWELDGIFDNQDNVIKYLEWAKIDYILLPLLEVKNSILEKTAKYLVSNGYAYQYNFSNYRLISLKGDDFYNINLNLRDSIGGIYKDNWMSGNVNIRIRDKISNCFQISGYYPNNWPKNNITIKINDNERKKIELKPGSSFETDLDFLNNLDMVYINIKTDKSFIPKEEGWNDDIRELAVLINKWSLIYKDKNNFIGFYDNPMKESWVEGNAKIIIENKNARKFNMTGYQPKQFPNNTITIRINNNESTSLEMIPGKSYNITLDFENNLDMIYIDINTEKTFIPILEGWNDDIRELGAFISSWSLE